MENLDGRNILAFIAATLRLLYFDFCYEGIVV